MMLQEFKLVDSVKSDIGSEILRMHHRLHCSSDQCYKEEAQKLAPAESTGLELKQINNWFINQRKRHWKPSEDMQFVLMDPTLHQHHHYPHFCMDNAICNPFTMDCTSTLL